MLLQTPVNASLLTVRKCIYRRKFLSVERKCNTRKPANTILSSVILQKEIEIGEKDNCGNGKST